tara:strand:+ start:4138 stop:5910 length:1773 start_codon:yes stop_codon:yes gene_type:complete
MRLLDLRISPAGQRGWGSETLVFGDDITQLYGPNGCGKTPVIHSIAFALGYPVRYRDDILEHCDSAILRAQHNGREIIFKRQISKNFHLECTLKGDKESHVFYNEKDISEFLFARLGVSGDALTSNQNEPTYPYISMFLPLFYIDQDTGYTSAYKSPSTFIKDQYSEMVRLALGVPAKHAFEKKRFLIEKKNDLESLNVAVVSKERFIERLEEQTEADGLSSTEIDSELKRLTTELDDLRSSYDATSDADFVLDRLIREKHNEHLSLDSRIRELESRINGFRRIQNEIEIEINTLSLNEESRRLFSSFQDICAQPGCGLFLNSSDSYGKNLLYLRDQIKDLDRNTKFQEVRLDEYSLASKKLSVEIETLKQSVETKERGSETDSLIAAISSITRSIIDLQSRKDKVERVESEKSEYVELLNKRRGLQNDIASMQGPTDGSDLRILEFRTQYKHKIIEWLDVLSTKNVSREISIDSDFNILFGSEKISQFSGSTLLRVILALRAAFFEILISRGGNSIEFLIFDTPKQHDIETKDFAAFIAKLKSFCSQRQAQIIFSTTEYHYESGDNDKEWLPTFSGFEQPMFLGNIEDE